MLSPCSPKVVDMNDLELEKLDKVDRQCIQHLCEATIMVPDKRGEQAWAVREVLDSGWENHVSLRGWLLI